MEWVINEKKLQANGLKWRELKEEGCRQGGRE